MLNDVQADGAGAAARHYGCAEHRETLEIIVPAYNEEGRIGVTLRALRRELDILDADGAIRVIDNGSTDGTAEVVDRVDRSANGTTTTVQGCARQGKGSAVTRGMLTSRADWVGFCDADLSTPASAIPDAVSYLRQGWPVVIGSRRMPEAERARRQSLLRRVGSTGFKVLRSGIIDGVNDTQCGFKFFQGDVARRIFAQIGSTGFAFDVEVLAIASDMGLAIKEIPVAWSSCGGSTFRPLRDGVAVARELASLRYRRAHRARVST